MSDLLDAAMEIFEEYKPVWLIAKCKCSICGYSYIGVLHKDKTTELECSNCGKMRSEAVEFYEPVEEK